MYTMTCSPAVANGITRITQDYTNNIPAMNAIAADTTYGSSFLGGQNHIALFKESAAKIDMKNACAYDQGCNEQMQNAMKDYFTGKTTSIADAMDAFKTALDAKYTGLTYDSSFDITTL